MHYGQLTMGFAAALPERLAPKRPLVRKWRASSRSSAFESLVSSIPAAQCLRGEGQTSPVAHCSTSRRSRAQCLRAPSRVSVVLASDIVVSPWRAKPAEASLAPGRQNTLVRATPNGHRETALHIAWFRPLPSVPGSARQEGLTVDSPPRDSRSKPLSWKRREIGRAHV